MTIAEAIEGFRGEWVATQAVTPRAAYERTLRVLAYWLEREGRSAADDLATLTGDDLERFVAWHAGSGLADDADGSRKAAIHVARLGAHLAAAGRADLDVGRDRLRGIVPS